MRANNQAVKIKGSRTVNAPESLNPSGRLHVRDPARKLGMGKVSHQEAGGDTTGMSKAPDAPISLFRFNVILDGRRPLNIPWTQCTTNGEASLGSFCYIRT
jgi:hypothetical protein